MSARAVLHAILLCALTLGTAPVARAQDLGVALSPILVIDSDRMFRASQVGQRINAGLEARLEALVAENRKIEGQLVAEELSLTEQRQTMDPTEFRVLANEFDQRVQGIRAAQDAKQRELQQLRDAQSKTFIDEVAPILSAIGRERGALVILERRSVFLSADTIDVTEEAIARINASFQDSQDSPESIDPAEPSEDENQQTDQSGDPSAE